MAVDEALLRSAENTNQITLRLYQWREPTLSLGYFQKAGDRAQHAASRKCPMVRRATGGGAIVHDHELTYSLVIPQRRSDYGTSSAWYDKVHQALIRTFASFGVSTHVCPETDRTLEQRFLCFQRRAKGDVLLANSKTPLQNAPRTTAMEARTAAERNSNAIKVVGSAQRRRRAALLQHGSILLQRSTAAPELAGIQQYFDAPLEVAELGARLLSHLEHLLSLSFVLEPLSEPETTLARKMLDEQFGSRKWTLKR